VELLTVSEVARRSGVSRTSIYRLAHRGALRPWSASGPGGRPMLRAEVVAELRRGVLLRQRVDSPWAPRRDRAPAAPVVAVEPEALELEALDDDDDETIEPPMGPGRPTAGPGGLPWAGPTGRLISSCRMPSGGSTSPGCWAPGCRMAS
jgi:excisionase family DNA binding protein